MEYAPAEGAKLVGCVLLTPGSGGGLGPGVAIHPQPFDDIRKPAAVGAIYTRLGMELSKGRQVRRCCSDGAHAEHPAPKLTCGVVLRAVGAQVTWAYQPTGEAIPELAGDKKGVDPTKPRYTIAVVQVRSAVARVGRRWFSVSLWVPWAEGEAATSRLEGSHRPCRRPRRSPPSSQRSTSCLL